MVVRGEGRRKKLIIAAWVVLSGRCHRDCEKCEAEPANKKAWDCEGGGEYDISDDVPWFKEKFDRCPVSFRNDMTNDVIYLYSNFSGRNILPGPGGLRDQPAWLCMAFRILDNVMGCIREREDGSR